MQLGSTAEQPKVLQDYLKASIAAGLSAMTLHVLDQVLGGARGMWPSPTRLQQSPPLWLTVSC